MANILVVDDDIDICNLFTYYLQSEGHHITIAHDGNEALERIKIAPFDLVISDILMPGMNGIDLTKKLIDDYPGIQILVCSEGGTTDAKEIVAAIVLSKAVNEGALQALMKPFSRRELISVVNGVLKGKSSIAN